MNPIPGTSAGTGIAVAPVAPQLGPGMIQFDQKKAPAFFGDVNKDSLSIQEWIVRIDHMRTSLGWTAAQTYHNAKNALFGAAAAIITSRCAVQEDHEETWAWLQKILKKQFGKCNTSRAYVDLMFAMKPELNIKADLNHFIAKIHANFALIHEAIADPTCEMNPAGGAYTPQQTLELLKAEKKRIVDTFSFAFMVNLLPPEVRTKVLEQKPTTMADTFDKVDEVQRMLLDEKRPLQHSPVVHASEGSYEALLNEVKKLRSKVEGSNNQNQTNNGRRNNNNKRNNGSNNASKMCNYCHKKGHGTIDCFKRKNDKAPCYNNKGEPYYPEGEQAGSNAQQTDAGQKGPGFRPWV